MSHEDNLRNLYNFIKIITTRYKEATKKRKHKLSKLEIRNACHMTLKQLLITETDYRNL